MGWWCGVGEVVSAVEVDVFVGGGGEMGEVMVGGGVPVALRSDGQRPSPKPRLPASPLLLVRSRLRQQVLAASHETVTFCPFTTVTPAGHVPDPWL